MREKYNQWLNYADLDQELKNVLLDYSEEEIEEAFGTDLVFGTGGMRGILGPGTNRLNIYTVRKVAYCYGKYLLESNPKPKAVIAYDNRLKSVDFAYVAAQALASIGVKVYLFDDLRSTPVLSFAIRYLQVDGGMMITASHNPPRYNGLKVYDQDGCQLSLELSDKLINIIQNEEKFFDIEVQDLKSLLANNQIEYIGLDVDKAYIEKLQEVLLHPEIDYRNLNVTFTPLHGTSTKLIRKIFNRYGFNVNYVTKQMINDPYFTTLTSPNPENFSAFDEAIKVARVHNSDIIIATDPDADRVGVCVRTKDGKYQLLSGNQVGAILIYYIVNNKRFDKTGMVITTIVTSDIGERIAKAYDLEVKRTLTGFKFIGEQMKLIENSQDYEFAFGYEESIGYIVKDIVRDKDALQSVVCILEAASYYLYQGKTLLDVLNEIYEKFGYFYDEVVNINLVGYEGSKKISNILNYFRNHYQELNLDFIIHEDYLTQIRYYTNQEEQINLPKSNVLKFYLPDGSWFAMRPSGTEPKMKIYLSIIGKTMNEAIDKANSIKQIILEKINLI